MADQENEHALANQASTEAGPDKHAPKAPDALKLEAIAGPCTGSIYSKPGLQQLTVGRTRVSKLHIKDPSVSEKHAQITWMGSAWEVADLGSSNGTAVNGSKLEPEGPSVTLKDGDVILFGEDTQLRVEITPVQDENVTVEQYLEAECSRLAQRLKGRAEQLANQLGADWAAEKAALLSGA